jgi:hypothetical protein
LKFVSVWQTGDAYPSNCPFQCGESDESLAFSEVPSCTILIFLDMILIFIKPPLVVNQKVQITPTAWTPPPTHMALLMPLSPLDPKKHTPPYKNNNTSSSAKWSQRNPPEILRCYPEVNPFWGPSFGLCSPDPCANHILNVVALCGPQRGRERG